MSIEEPKYFKFDGIELTKDKNGKLTLNTKIASVINDPQDKINIQNLLNTKPTKPTETVGGGNKTHKQYQRNRKITKRRQLRKHKSTNYKKVKHNTTSRM